MSETLEIKLNEELRVERNPRNQTEWRIESELARGKWKDGLALV